MDKLITATLEPDKEKEIARIRQIADKEPIYKVKLTKIDIFLESHSNEFFLIDLKTVKPNIGEFKGYKRTLLEWVAAEFVKDKNIKINTLIGIPYNPYEPEPYNRWTMKGMFDLEKEILVGDELWEFFGGKGTYNDLLDCFEEVGIELRSEIDKYFEKFK